MTTTTSKISNDSINKTRRAAFEERLGAEGAADWAGLLDEWLGPNIDVYGRLRDKSDYSQRASKR